MEDGENDLIDHDNVSVSPEQRQSFDTSQRLTRRAFIKGIAAAATHAAVNSTPLGMAVNIASRVINREQQPANPEVMEGYTPRTLLLDLTSQNREEALWQMLGDYNPQYIEVPGTRENAANQVFTEKEGHADLVTGVFRRTLENAGVGTNFSPAVIPLQESLSFTFLQGSIEGNSFVTTSRASIDMESIKNTLTPILENNDDIRVLNFSAMNNMEDRYRIQLETHPLARHDQDVRVGDNVFELVAVLPREFGVQDVPNGYETRQITVLGINNNEPFQAPVPYQERNGVRNYYDYVTPEVYERLNEEYQSESLNEYPLSLQENRVSLSSFDLERIEAYNPVWAKENLLKMIDFADSFPDRMVVAAAGNEGNFFYQARQELKAELEAQGRSWPENLMFVGVSHGDGSESNNVQADGADIYVRAEDFPEITGSDGKLSASEATAMVSAVADLIYQSQVSAQEGIVPNEIPRNIRQILLSDQITADGRYRGVRTEGEQNSQEFPWRENVRFLDRNAYLTTLAPAGRG